jgi:hypothetical protein
MDETGFWKIVQDANDSSDGDMDRKCDALRQQISSLSKADAIEFAQLFDAMMGKAYNYPLWGAAYVINGGCSDDTFDDFCSSLISRGRQAFERALSDPDALADDPDESDWFYEGYQYAVTEGVVAVAGDRPQRSMPDQPSGAEWQEEEELDRLFPKLSAKYG